MKKLIVLFFSAALGISFLFIGFGSYFGQSHVIKVGDIKVTSNEFSREYENYKIEKQFSECYMLVSTVLCPCWAIIMPTIKPYRASASVKIRINTMGANNFD